jgi:hypothetical protein
VRGGSGHGLDGWRAIYGAIAEAFGRFPEWTPAILEGIPSLPRSVRAIASFHLPDDAPVCNLDDPALLQTLGLLPSDIVTRDYARSRAWARRIYESGNWSDARWWSYYDPQWASFGLWSGGESNGLEADCSMSAERK